MVKLKVWVLGSAMAVSCLLGHAQMPAGAHSVDDHSRENAINQQIADAETALEHGDYAGAATKLKALAVARPKDGRVLYDLGFAEDHSGDEDGAAKAYAGAIAADDSLAEAKVSLGLLNARAGRTKAAHEELLAAANQSSATAELRGRAFRALANLDEGENPIVANDELLEALKLTPETPADVLMSAVLAEQMGEPALAETAFRKALKATPGDPEATAGLAHVLQLQKKSAEADTVVTEGLQEHPGDPRLVAQAATIYAAEGKAAQAIPMLEALRKQDPAFAGNAEMTRVLAHLYESQNDEVTAETLYVKLLAQLPGDPSVLDDLGSAQVRLGRYAEAEKSLAKAFGMRKEFDDDDLWGETAEHLAFAASRNNDPKITLQALAARAIVLPNTPASLFLEATAHDTLHEVKQARESYKAFLAVADGKFPDQEFEARHRLVALEHMK
jgi:tetratricopeptide (TPR) repeat protein